MLEKTLPNAGAHMLTISTTAVDLATAITTAAGEAFALPTDTNAARIIVETNSVRILMDGNTPTAANGLLLDSAGNQTGINLYGDTIGKVKLIRAGAADASVYVSVGTATPNF